MTNSLGIILNCAGSGRERMSYYEGILAFQKVHCLPVYFHIRHSPEGTV